MKNIFKKGDVRFLASLVVFALFIFLSHEVLQRLKSAPDETNDSSAGNKYYKAGAKASADSITARDKSSPAKITVKPLKKPDKAYVAIVVDDLGVNFRLAKRFMELGPDFTFSVLPGRTYTTKIAKAVKESGFDLMLHLPMEPYSYPEDDPGDGALFLSMSGGEIRRGLNEMLALIPGIQGVNNHMGARFSEDCAKMSVVMSILKENDMFFLDSKTSKLSCGTKTAREYGVPSASRTVFLDNDKARSKILKQLDTLIRKSKRYGFAVAICHPYPETADTFKDLQKILDDNNIEIKSMSEIIKLSMLREKEKQARFITLGAMVQQ